MMRQPEQRMISHYLYTNRTQLSLHDYAEENQGCTVRMLTHPQAPSLSLGHVLDHCGAMSRPLTRDDVELAKRRLDKFAFVGLTEEWPLSICLWRAMFGGLCYGADFEDTRPGDNKNA